MARGAILSNEDKTHLHNELISACEYGWSKEGYRKTNIQYLCKKVGISVGTFYTIFASKEDVFYETLIAIQHRLETTFRETMLKQPSRDGFTKSLKTLYHEYKGKPFLYDATELTALLGKLPPEQVQTLAFDNEQFFREMIQVSNLKLKVEENIAFGVFSSLLSTTVNRDVIQERCDNESVFEFMVNHLISYIFD